MNTQQTFRAKLEDLRSRLRDDVTMRRSISAATGISVPLISMFQQGSRGLSFANADKLLAHLDAQDSKTPAKPEAVSKPTPKPKATPKPEVVPHLLVDITQGMTVGPARKDAVQEPAVHDTAKVWTKDPTPATSRADETALKRLEAKRSDLVKRLNYVDSALMRCK